MEINRFTLQRENFSSDEAFAQEVGRATMMFANAGYQMKTYWDDKGLGIFIIEYAWRYPEFGIGLDWHKDDF